MELKDYPEFDKNDVNEVLKYCAFLRGTHNLLHRTLCEFDWFVEACMYNKDIQWAGISEIYGADIREKYVQKFKQIYDHSDRDIIVKYAQLFMEYCYDVYVTRNEGW